MIWFRSTLLFRGLALVFLLFFFTCAEARARLWQTTTNQSFEAEFVRVEGANGIFIVKGKEYPYPLSYLSVADRLFIGRITNHQNPATAVTPLPPPHLASAPHITAVGGTGLQLAGQPLKPGGEAVIDLPVTNPDELRELQKTYGKPSAQARVLMAVPNDFDPAKKSYPLFIVSTSADGAASNIGVAHQYVPAALRNGYVLLAVDGQFGKPAQGDSIDFRWALVSAALDAIAQEWPPAGHWQVATGGISGGAGYASHQALKLAEEGKTVAGIFLAVSSWNPTRFPDELQKVAAIMREVPIFLSVGENDQIVTKAVAKRSHEALVKEGFKEVRFEHFAGGHELNLPQFQKALAWFEEENADK